MALRIVPMPIFCFSGIQSKRTAMLIIKVAKPILKFVFIEIPWAKTVQGLTPCEEAINIVSPRPNKNNPKVKKINVFILGFKIKGSEELQDKIGIFLIENIFLIISI